MADTKNRFTKSRSLEEIPLPPNWSVPFDEAICWRGGSEAQEKRHRMRGEKPCTNCHDAALRASEDRQSRKASND